MTFDVTSFKTPAGCCSGQIHWTYTNADGSINGRTPVTTEQLPEVNPATRTPAQIDTWLDSNAGNTPEELDAAIATNNMRKHDEAEQHEFVNEDGSWVQIAEPAPEAEAE